MEKLPGIPVSDADWQQTPKSVQLLVVALLEVQQRVKQLERQVAELQRGGRRRRGSPPSPPSGQSEEASASTSSRRKRPSGRSPGAGPGHKGHGRTLLSVEQVDTLVPVKPTSCRQCGHALSGDDPHAQRRQVFEIPPVRPQVTEYQVHTLRGPGGDVLTEADGPESVPRSSFGPRVQAWIGLLSGAYRMSKRNIVALLADAFSLDLAVGSVSQLEQQVSEALSAPVEEARDYVRQQAAVHIDETGWREAREKAWLWTVATDLVTVFAIRSRRDSEVARELLGDDTAAMVGSDRHTAYSYLPVLQRQACWSLERTFEKFVDRGGDAAWVGQQLLEFTHQIFTWWHRVRDGTLKRSSLQTYVSDLRLRFRSRLWQGELLADEKTARTCANLGAIEPALWTFVRKEGVGTAGRTGDAGAGASPEESQRRCRLLEGIGHRFAGSQRHRAVRGAEEDQALRVAPDAGAQGSDSEGSESQGSDCASCARSEDEPNTGSERRRPSRSSDRSRKRLASDNFRCAVTVKCRANGRWYAWQTTSSS